MQRKRLDASDVRKALMHAHLGSPRFETPLQEAADYLNYQLALAILPSLDKADDDAIVEFCQYSSELIKLKLYKYLHALGCRISGIDQKITEEERREKKA
jgi:hypothetical protein